MASSFTVGGTRGTFDEGLADEVAGVLDQAFGEEGDWEGSAPRRFDAADAASRRDLLARASAELGEDAIPNLIALGEADRGVYLPAACRAVSLPTSAGTLRCASLPGLRRELAEVAERWGVALDDRSLLARLDGGGPPEVVALIRLALAANEAVRRDCPLWIFG